MIQNLCSTVKSRRSAGLETVYRSCGPFKCTSRTSARAIRYGTSKNTRTRYALMLTQPFHIWKTNTRTRILGGKSKLQRKIARFLGIGRQPNKLSLMLNAPVMRHLYKDHNKLLMISSGTLVYSTCRMVHVCP